MQLTDEGKVIALDVAKRHILLTDFLRDFLGVEEERSEEEACLIEHSMSLETAKKLEEFLEEHHGYESKIPF